MCMENSEIIQFVFHSSNMYSDFVLTKTVETLDKTNSTVFISCVDTHTFSQHSTFGLLMSKQTLERKGNCGSPSCLFLLCHHFQC